MLIKWLEKNYFLSWIITIIIAGAMFYVSSLTFPPAKNPIGIALKPLIYHIGSFTILGFFLAISLIRGKNKSLVLLVITLGVLYAISDEFHQLFVPGRYFSSYDIFLDSFGIILASTTYLIYKRDEI